MKWHRRGHVYAPDGGRWWARGYAAFPTVEVRDDVLRVYFTALDEHAFGRTGFVDLDARDPRRVLRESPDPVLDLGDLGAFDDSGATAFSVVADGEATRLYYQGWQRTQRIPHLIFTGLAVDHRRDGSFEKHGRTPVLDRTEDDPYLRGAPYVMRAGAGWRMWYASGRHWVSDEHGLHYEVEIRHAASSDGVHWDSDPIPCLVPEPPYEYAVGRPSVLLDGSTYRMWYSIRSFDQPYRIGYAESSDGIAWARRDSLAGIERSSEGWDSGMICYPQVVRLDDRLLMFYNGNQHGATGFGYAEAG